MQTAALVVALAAGALSASVHINGRIALEADVDITTFSRGWTKGAASPKDATIRMTVAVKQQKLDELTDTLLRVSDPKNSAYGKHLTKEQVDELVAPTSSSVAEVTRFLASYGVSNCDHSANSDFIHCDVTVAQAESMLGINYFSWTHPAKPGVTVYRADRHYTLPSTVASVVDFVSPTTRFPSTRPRVTAAVTSQTPERTNTPESLRTLYSVGDVEGTAPANRMACTAFLKQHYLQGDLDKFWKRYYPKAVGRKVKVVGDNHGLAGVEASLDIQYISTMGGGVEVEFWTYDGSAPDNRQNEPFLTWIYQVGNTSDAEVPKVFSTSYGEPEDTVSLAYMNRIEAEFQKTGVRGISLMFASGDSGVAPDDGQCEHGRFAGQWPAGSPWVTGVGGTEGGGDGENEHAWSGSSGGFSDRWARPDFQSDAVAKYLKTAKLPDSQHFNGTSRGFPDVSAQATNFLVINDGFTTPVAGTSCASPTFSGVFALLNDLRLAAGKSTLGWVNPFFYQNPTIFNDITEGSNEAGIGCGDTGFEAIEGWDPVTGLGTPNYAKMKEAVLSLP